MMIAGLHPFILGGVLLFVIGCAMFLVRRSMLLSMAGVQLALLSIAFLFLTFSAKSEGAGTRALVVLLLAVAHAVVSTAVSIIVFRRRGSVNLDELRELRG